MKLQGHATREGTERYKKRFEDRLPGHFRIAGDVWISSVGLGTYLGEPDSKTDVQYRDTAVRALELGLNAFDSAINYRHQRSERSLGEALQAAVRSGSVQRDEVIVATKGGFLSFDGAVPPDPQRFFQEKFLAPGLLRPEEIAAGCHSMAPRFLESQVEQSLENLQLETLDVYYLHNPETQLGEIEKEEFYRRVRAAFEKLEAMVSQGKIRTYGAATWTAFRVGADAREAISLPRLVELATEVGGKDHHFRAIQLPLNLGMPEAILVRNQLLNGKRVSLLDAAQEFGLTVFTSASILQGQLSRSLPPKAQNWFPGLRTDAQRAIQFTRSVPGIGCALVGMSHIEHLEENLETARIPPLSREEMSKLF